MLQVSAERRSVLTLALFLNHRLFESYLDYLKQVRDASDGTIGEALTSAVSACRWLYRKEPSAMAKGSAMPRSFIFMAIPSTELGSSACPKRSTTAKLRLLSSQHCTVRLFPITKSLKVEGEASVEIVYVHGHVVVSAVPVTVVFDLTREADGRTAKGRLVWLLLLYVDEENISRKLKCVICLAPAINPRVHKGCNTVAGTVPICFWVERGTPAVQRVGKSVPKSLCSQMI